MGGVRKRPRMARLEPVHGLGARHRRPIRRRYLYRMPAVAKIIECEPQRKVTWEVSAPGFHARHSYLFEPLGPDSSRFGSWEVAEGRSYGLMRRFWLAHFRFVRDQSLAGACTLGERGS